VKFRLIRAGEVEDVDGEGVFILGVAVGAGCPHARLTKIRITDDKKIRFKD
jgi:hypothetical protein